MSSAHPDLDFKPEMPQRLDHGIGIVGAGGVVNYAHLPVYAQAGFKVVAITDKDRTRAEKTADEHKVPAVYDSLEDLLANPEVEIVDIAVYPWETLNIGEQAVRAGKHILCQKPLSDEYSKAARSRPRRGCSLIGIHETVNQSCKAVLRGHLIIGKEPVTASEPGPKSRGREG